MAQIITLNRLCEAVAIERGVAIEAIVNGTRRRPVSWARQEFMHKARIAGYSTPEIGRYLGRHHTTVIEGSEAHRERVTYNQQRA